MGEADKCLEWLDKAVEDRDGSFIHVHADPLYEPLHSHSRLKALVRKMNVTEQ